MDNNQLNYEELHLFMKGYQSDIDNHLEGKESYNVAVNGRLFSENGILSYQSVQGTRKVYENDNIIKYLGWAAFKDELIVFVKTNLEVEEYGTEITVTSVYSESFFSDSPPGESIIVFNFEDYITVEQHTEIIPEVDDPDSFDQNLSCNNESGVLEGENFGLFEERPFVGNALCTLSDDIIPYHNKEYSDAIYSLKWDDNGQLVSKLLYLGYLNFPMNAKIVTQPVWENQFYKRVYFSDYVNESRVVNIADKKLMQRRAGEFSFNISGTMLNPRLKSIDEDGQLKPMTVMYMYRLVSDNGQVSNYSALSQPVKILKEYGPDPIISGGNVSEATNKSVTMYCIVPDYRNYKEIEFIAVEFEAENMPTSIKIIGKKQVDYYVEFKHIGNESEYSSNLTLNDLFSNNINFKYNSDFETKNNKLIASGLRNNPVLLNDNDLTLDFALSSFSLKGEGFDCLLNPDPSKYHLIDKNRTSPYKFVYRKLFRDIIIFETTIFKLGIKNSNQFYEFEIENNGNQYTSVIDSVYNKLNQLQEEDPDFNLKLPNLKIKKVNEGILFERLNENLYTDFYDYFLSSENIQIIVDVSNDVKMSPDTIPWPEINDNWPNPNASTHFYNSSLVYGAVSDGWFRGNGVRVTMRSKYSPLIEPSVDWFDGTSPIVKMPTPYTDTNADFLGTTINLSGLSSKGFMKGEIYRLGIQWFNNGERLFTTILGDIKIPENGWPVKEVDYDNNVIPRDPSWVPITNNFIYKNHFKKDSVLWAHKIELQFDVRISCQLSKQVDSYQIVYVERTPSNRSILTQGLTGPLERINNEDTSNENWSKIPEVLQRKWILPVMGGPVYDNNGFINYDYDPNNNFPPNTWDNDPNSIPVSLYEFGTSWVGRRITTHRKLFWFDSPEFVFNKIDNDISSFKIDNLESVTPDHSKQSILNGFNRDSSIPGRGVTALDENGNINANSSNVSNGHTHHISTTDDVLPFGIPKFSQKISNSYIAGTPEDNPRFVNVSVFSNSNRGKNSGSLFGFPSDLFEIEKSKEVGDGEVLSPFQMDEVFEISNNAMTLGIPVWYYNGQVRGIEKSGYVKSANIASGRRSIFIKTKENFYTDELLNSSAYIIWGREDEAGPSSQAFLGYNVLKGRSAHQIINLIREDLSFLYGGRTDYAYRSNLYIPLSDIIPVNKKKEVSQIFNVKGDTYTSLYLRNKTNFFYAQDPNGSSWNSRTKNFKGAWCYAVVLESSIEPKFNNGEEFYKKLSGVDFSYDEKYNNAYKQENNIRVSIPQPLNFKDDPNLNNIIAVSDVKMSGDFYDAWTRFKVNEFYEMDKDKGTVFNLAKQNDEVYAIQEHQTSVIQIDDRALITTDSGAPINIGTGSGNSIQGHTPISSFGTSIRRAVATSDFGFVFFDERKKEFVKIKDPLLLANHIYLKYEKFFENNPIIDTEAYFDEKFKESNIRFRTKTGVNFLLSYNEVLKVFNGRIEYDNDIYAKFQEKTFAPYSNSSKLGLLNEGNELEFFEEEKDLLFGVSSAPQYPYTKIFKGIGIVLNTNYPIESAKFVTSLGHERTIPGTHHYYQIREGVHTLPAKNPYDYGDIRGEWGEIVLRIKSINNSKIKILSIINYVRNSYK